MQRFDNLFGWFNQHQTTGYAFIRIFLGAALLVRGVLLISNPDALTQLIDDNSLHMWFSYITIGHIVGGISLILGIVTRIGAFIQIPILFSAVLFVHAEKGLMIGGQALELAALVLFLLIVFFLFGAGPLSLDNYLSKKK